MTSRSRRVPWQVAALWMLAAGGLFLVAYPAAQAVTALRSDVPSAFMAWEQAIPFMPWAIVPYMSLDAFFVASFFLCRSRAELGAHGRRILFAIVLSAACFLIFPLRFGFERPESDGLAGWLFALLGSFDQPFNQAPSLHIGLLLILWPIYAARCHGSIAGLLHIWFGLIFGSTLLTYQHHAVDLVGGIAVAVLAFYFFPTLEPAPRPAPGRQPASVRLAARYGAGAVALAGLGSLWLPWSALLMWPALALAIVAGGYAGLGPIVFRKLGGRLSLPSRLLLAPYLIGAAVARRLQRPAAGGPWRAGSNLRVGPQLTGIEARQIVDDGVVAVLDLTAEFTESALFKGIAYCNLPVLDLTAPSPAQLRAAVDFITRHGQRGEVYVHCALGLGRSACVAAAYLLASGRAAGVEAAVARLRCGNPKIALSGSQLAALRAWHGRRRPEALPRPLAPAVASG